MKQNRWAALMTALSLTLALTAFAAETMPPAETSAPAETSLAGPDNGGAREPDAIDMPVAEKTQKDAAELGKLLNQVTVNPTTLSKVTFDQIEGLMREKNQQIRGFDITINYLQNMDYDAQISLMRDALNGIANIQFYLGTVGSGFAGTAYEQTYDSLHTAFANIRDGKTQRENAGIVRQLRSAKAQMVLGAESLYVSLVGLENQRTALNRQLAALDRTIAELELRQSLGQISAQKLQEVKGGRTKLVSGISTLEMNIRTLKYQLENLLGATLTGKLTLGSVPAVTAEQIAAMDQERDLAAYREVSYDLYAAARTLQDQEETYTDALKASGYSKAGSAYAAAEMTWNVAQTTYNSTIQSYELKFRTLYSKVKDYYQTWLAAQAALEDQRTAYRTAEVKFNQGNLSKNAFLTAQDELTTAQEAVAAAANDLFSSYNSYCWAVQSGILN